jgi:23S rRNA G2445 N2-methylase RlmL
VESLSGSIDLTEDVAIGDGWILSNPPYGVRVGESRDLRDLYSALGTALKTKHGWRIGLLTSDAVLAAQMRLPLWSRFATSNGGIPVSFLVSEKSEKAAVRSLKARAGGVSREV